MSIKRIRGLSVLLVILLLTGCGLSDTPVPPGSSQISTKPESNHYMTGLRVNYGELKESGAVFTDEAVEFQDPVIEEMLRTILGKPDGEVLRSDLQSIHAIYWRSGNRYWSNLQSDDGKLPKDGSEWYSTGQPQTLADLAYCDNLQWLEIGAIELPSLEPLYFHLIFLYRYCVCFFPYIFPYTLNNLRKVLSVFLSFRRLFLTYYHRFRHPLRFKSLSLRHRKTVWNLNPDGFFLLYRVYRRPRDFER